MAGSSSDAPRPPTIAQKMMIAVRLWASGHRRGADRVGEQPQDVRPLAADEVGHLAADQDERGGDQRLERDRGLDAAHGGVEVLDHGRDGDVHQRRVDDEHEHRRRQQQGQPRSCADSLTGTGSLASLLTGPPSSSARSRCSGCSPHVLLGAAPPRLTPGGWGGVSDPAVWPTHPAGRRPCGVPSQGTGAHGASRPGPGTRQVVTEDPSRADRESVGLVLGG